MKQMVPCKGCQELISPIAIKCPKCGAILDIEKARELWPEIYGKPAVTMPVVDIAAVLQEPPVKRGPGRPRKEVS